MVNHLRYRLKSNARLDTLLIQCIEYMVGHNAGNMSDDEHEDSETNYDDTNHLNTVTISSLVKHFADFDRDDYDENET